jgi:hypothetical protein
MPEISRFLGIVIAYSTASMASRIFTRFTANTKSRSKWESGKIHGQFPVRALRLVREWPDLRKEELIENWHLARQGQPLKSIAPLE